MYPSPESIAESIAILASHPDSADLSAVRQALDTVEANRVNALLRATLDLEAVKQPRGRRFFIAYSYCAHNDNRRQ